MANRLTVLTPAFAMRSLETSRTASREKAEGIGVSVGVGHRVEIVGDKVAGDANPDWLY